MLVLCYPKCTTCQKALKWLDERGVSCTVRNIKEENPAYEELKEWYGRSGLPLKRFFNTSGLQYKALGLKDKLPCHERGEEQLRLLATDGMLVKRPLLVTRRGSFRAFGRRNGRACWKNKRTGRLRPMPQAPRAASLHAVSAGDRVLKKGDRGRGIGEIDEEESRRPQPQEPPDLQRAAAEPPFSRRRQLTRQETAAAIK